MVDTSNWVDHFRKADTRLECLINDQDVGLHPFTLGELLLGGVPCAGEIAAQLALLAAPPVASATEMVVFIKWAKLAGTGIGYVDAHLLMSARLCGGTVLTKDRHLHEQATRLGVAYPPA